MVILLSLIPMGLVFAEGCQIDEELPSNSELTSKIEQCISARSGEGPSPNSITEFTCPNAEEFKINGRPITNETLAHAIAINLAFNKADKDIKKYMQQLQKNREPDPTKWIEDIHQCTEKIKSIYDNICNFNTLNARLNENKDKQYIISVYAFPQTLCKPLAEKKTLGWYYMGTIMMSDGIAKNHKNSTDTWTNEIK